MSNIAKIRTSGTLGDYDPQGIHKDTIYLVEDTDTILYNGKTLTNEEVEESIEELRKEIPNVVSERVVDEDNFPEISTLTREDLKKDLFDDMWKEAFGQYGDVDHTHIENGKPAPYYGNGLWLTYEEAQEIYYVSIGKTNFAKGDDLSFLYGSQSLSLKTILPIKFTPGMLGASRLVDLSRICHTNQIIRAISFLPDSGFVFINDLTYSFWQCWLLTHILGVLALWPGTQIPSTAFAGCRNLITLNLKGLNSNAILSECGKLSAESIRYMIEKRAGTNTITITLHADVYSKIISNEDEWEGILELAQSKNITLTS